MCRVPHEQCVNWAFRAFSSGGHMQNPTWVMWWLQDSNTHFMFNASYYWLGTYNGSLIKVSNKNLAINIASIFHHHCPWIPSNVSRKDPGIPISFNLPSSSCQLSNNYKRCLHLRQCHTIIGIFIHWVRSLQWHSRPIAAIMVRTPVIQCLASLWTSSKRSSESLTAHPKLNLESIV